MTEHDTGLTSDLQRGHAEHDAGRCPHAAKYGPWSIDLIVDNGISAGGSPKPGIRTQPRDLAFSISPL